MQPYAIRRHREIALPGKVLIATVLTTVGIYAFKNYIKPMLIGHNRRKNEEFANDYFKKHPKNVE